MKKRTVFISEDTETKKLIVLNMALLLITARFAPAATLLVPIEYSTIQAAIDDANNGDTIIVQPGIYPESVQFHGKDITLTSTNPVDSNVVASTRIKSVWFLGTEDPNCILTGFKIYERIGGGTNHTHATISHCLLIGNIVPRGTVIKNCDGTISNCIVADNWPSGNFIDAAISGCSGVIRNCTIAHNLDGMIVEGTTTIENCVIYHNSVIQQIKGFGTLNVLYSNVEGGAGNLLHGYRQLGSGKYRCRPMLRLCSHWRLSFKVSCGQVGCKRGTMDERRGDESLY